MNPMNPVARSGVLALVLLLAACGGSEPAHSDAQGHGGESAEAMAKGPHGGRLLEKDGIGVEVTIYETGVEPQFRVYLYRDDKALPPNQGQVAIALTRLGGQVDNHAFVPEGDYLKSQSIVTEPHSFDVEVRADIAGKTARWTYGSYEGRTTIPAAMAASSGIEVATAGPGSVVDEALLQGTVVSIETRRARVMARFPGVVRELRAATGDEVAAGAVLAVIDSNDSLQRYNVVAPMAGTVLARTATVGEISGDQPLFEIADLSEVAIEAQAFGKVGARVAVGQPVEVVRVADGASASTTIERVLPTTRQNQSTTVRARIGNADGRWRPGSAIEARVALSGREAAVVIRPEALQRFRDNDVVFVRVGDVYEARPLVLGARSRAAVEVLEGLAAGAEYVTAQSFLIRADIEKSGASHDH